MPETVTAELIPVEPKITVYVSAGSNRYHRTPDCKALESMQLLNEDMSGEDISVCHAFTPTTTEAASRGGKTPCRLCKPELAVVADAFGHEPVPVSSLGNIFTDFSGCSSCRQDETPQVCARCLEFDQRHLFRIPTHPVHWPCTSAVVLGLVPRTVEQDAALRKAVHGCETPETHNWGCPCAPATPAP